MRSNANYTTPGLTQRTMGASLASESRLSRFGGPARRVIPVEEDPEEERPAGTNAPMSPISGMLEIAVAD